MPLSLSLLGTFEVRDASGAICDFRTHTTRLLLAYLAIEGDRSHEREHLARLFWVDSPPDQALTNLRQALHRLRQVIEPAEAEGTVLLITRNSVQINPAAITYIDAVSFSTAIAEAQQHRHRAADRCAVCAATLRAALDLYHGDLLAGLHTSDSPQFDEWLHQQRERQHAELIVALATLAAHTHYRGDTQQAATYLRRWLTLEPWSEDAHYRLMEVLDAAGQRGSALRQFDRCRDTLLREFGIEPSERTIQLAQRIRHSPSHTLRGVPQHRIGVAHDLDVLRATLFPSSQFIGREYELRQIIELLSDPHYRLLTLVGSGGVGKTRLAIEAAAATAYMFTGGAIVVPLAGVTRGDQIFSALATELQLPRTPNSSVIDQVCERLRDDELLVVLDNCEQIADANVAINRLITHAPKVTIVATSRTALQLRAERVVPVAGLSLAAMGSAPPADSYAAGRLFLHLTQRVRGDDGVFDHDPALIAECCRLLGGEPLALELLVFQLSHRSLAEGVADLRRSLTELTTIMPDVPLRHQSTRAVFEWSWGLLSVQARQLLARLSVFRGGFTLAAANAVLHGFMLSPSDLSDTLAVLVHASLMRREPHGRYMVHELVRQFAAVHLGEDADLAHEQHAVFYLGLVAQQAGDLYRHNANAAERIINAERDNVWVAWEWVLAVGRLDLVALALDGLMRFFQRTNTDEGARVFTAAVARTRQILTTADSPAARRTVSELLCCQSALLSALTRTSEAQAAAVAALALSEGSWFAEANSRLYYGWSHIGTLDLVEAERQLTQAVQLADHWSDDTTERDRAQFIQTHALRMLGYVAHLRGDYPLAMSYYRRCRSAYHALQTPRYESQILLLSAETQRCLGDYGGAKADYEEALDLIRDTGNLDIEQGLLNNVGDILTHLGCYQQADAHLTEALNLAKRLCNTSAEARACEGLSRVARCRGNYHQAEVYARRALSHPENRDRGWHLTTLASAIEAQGRLSEAARLYEESVSWWGTQGVDDPIVEPLAGLARIALLRGALPDALAYAEELYRRFAHWIKLLEPLRIYMTCWHIFRTANDPRAAHIVHQAAQILREQVANIHDPNLRTIFLEQIAVHREIVAVFGVVADGQLSHEYTD